jgi:hypothetical protein
MCPKTFSPDSMPGPGSEEPRVWGHPAPAPYRGQVLVFNVARSMTTVHGAAHHSRGVHRKLALTPHMSERRCRRGALTLEISISQLSYAYSLRSRNNVLCQVPRQHDHRCYLVCAARRS